MKEYLEQTLHQNIQLYDYVDLKKLPLADRKAFRFYIMNINGQECLLASPDEEQHLSNLRKQQKRLERYTGYLCAFYLKKLNYYAKDKMVEEGIPFVWENHQVYLPFLGLLLNQNDGRMLKPCMQISFLTQKLLLKALYENWQGITVTKAAELLGVSKMSITRCYDEIEVLEMPFLQTKSRSRKFYSQTDKKEMWKLLEPYMRNPLIKTFYLKEKIEDGLIFSGMSALAEYSMIEDNAYLTYGIEKKQLKSLQMGKRKEVLEADEAGCVIQELGYILPYKEEKMVDPLSLKLILTEEFTDPRVEKAIDDMLEEYVW